MIDLTDKSTAASSSQPSMWRVPAFLLALTVIPIAAGAVRLVGMTGVPAITPDNARFLADPVPTVLHIVSASVWCILGAFQFSQGIRRRRPNWHRRAGRVLAPVGLVAALSALWLTCFYPRAGYDGQLVFLMRLATGSAMALFICLGVAAILRRDVPTHRAWMMRSYALALGAGTQVLTHLPLFLIDDMWSEHSRALAMGSAWLINLAVAEWFIRRQPGLPASSPALAGAR